MEFLSLKEWSPYIAGIAIGGLNTLAFYISDSYLGCSGAFSKASAMIVKCAMGKKADNNPFYKNISFSIDWGLMLIFGVLVGAFISARLSGVFEIVWVPVLWAQKFGDNPFIRWCFAVLGGVFIGLGARWAGGCTSGHGISGTIQLTVSSWLAVMSFFLSGAICAVFIYKII